MISVVIPTVGRPSLHELLARLDDPDLEIVVVDDRPDPEPLTAARGRVIAGPARGPAAARNAGWRAARHEWVVFLDDDVLPDADWPRRLRDDLAAAGPEVGGVQGVLSVPLPENRRPTDWERVTAGLAAGAWITADMAFRRAALSAVGGFDERLPRAFREDAELAFRVRQAGWKLRRGDRRTTHPVRAESRWVSVRTQRGNADDALLRRLYGPQWRDLLAIPAGRRSRHAAITVAGVLALAGGAVAAATRRPGWAVAAAVAGAAWAAGTAEFAAARIVPGPRDRREVATMLVTSVAIPPVAITHWLRGWWRWRSAEPASAPSQNRAATPAESPATSRAATPAESPATSRAATPAEGPAGSHAAAGSPAASRAATPAEGPAGAPAAKAVAG
ncbi:transferase [Actinoplanes ianthinogenes]|uniref:glycosyltransferase family 2 protein n=1 Tax=Actinoplanes ianthinogenes TaxID=122358 RepID=UPI001670EB38|nr:glycosyltransferase [Actinoplanes ianthinogenes]GGR13171.1 transferase [Actinoplanes ianthinogenes]